MNQISEQLENLTKLFGERQFVIPEFQRPYTWGEAECGKLWDDLLLVYNNVVHDRNHSCEIHFMGTIIVYPSELKADPFSNYDIQERYDVVDGQQRLTTLTLLATAFHCKKPQKNLQTIARVLDEDHNPVNELRVLTKVLEDRPDELAEIILHPSPRDIKPIRIKKNDASRTNNFLFFWKKIDAWYKEQNDQVEKLDLLIKVFLNKLGVLPIICGSQESAFRIFEVVNNRGKPLAEADIFKAKILDNLAKVKGGLSDEQKDFLQEWKSWCEEGVEDFLFKALMRVKIGQSGNTDTTDIAIRKYFLEKKKESFDNPQTLIKDLKLLFAVMQWKRPAEVNILWAILERYPNEAWKWPIVAYLYEYGNVGENGFDLPEDRCSEFIGLCKMLIKYVYGKGLIGSGTLNDLKSMSYKQCARIFAHEKQDESLLLSTDDANSLSNWIEGLDSFECYKAGFQYGAGIVMLCSYLLHDDYDSLASFSQMIEGGRIDIEHICPKSWANADGWTEDVWKKLVNTIGNLMPLEKAINIQVSDSCFQRKKVNPGRKNCKSYKDSLSPEANELAAIQQDKWLPDDVRKRTALKAEVLKKFFLGGE